jgi:hypothetical protein
VAAVDQLIEERRVDPLHVGQLTDEEEHLHG